MEKNELKIEYENRSAAHHRAAANVREALTLFLDEQNVPHLAVLARLKDFESFFDKSIAKNIGEMRKLVKKS